MFRFLRAMPLVVFLLLVGCGSSYTNTGTPASPVPSTPGASPTPTQAPAHFKVGQSAQVGANWLVTISKVTISSGSEFVKPKAGDEFLVIAASIKNTSGAEQTFTYLGQFTFRDASGVTYDPTYLDTARNAPDGKVEAGGLLSGDLVYEVPTSLHQFMLFFEANPFESGQTIWDISA